MSKRSLSFRNVGIITQVTQILNFILNFRLVGPNDNEDRGIVDIAEKIYQAKIRCAAECAYAHMKNKETDDPSKKIDIVKLFKEYRL